MGMLADLFVASMEDALQYEGSPYDETGTIEKYQRVEYKGLTGLEFGVLWAMLLGEEWDARRHMLTDVKFGEEGESWLHGFPSELVQLLGNLDDARLDAVASRWIGTEEMANWRPQEAKQLLVDVRRLSRESLSSGNGLFLWGAL
jgi:hypothetical protein